MKAGVDFPSLFEKDNFKSRRTTGHNLYDPECLISGQEIKDGMTFQNSSRSWISEYHYRVACSQLLTPEQILETAPRKLNTEFFVHCSDLGYAEV